MRTSELTRRAMGVRRLLAPMAAVLLIGIGGGSVVCGAQEAPVRTTRLIGRILDSLGGPVSGAEVSVLPEKRLRALTNSSGAFSIDSVPVGTVQLSVRRVGYAPTSFSAELKAGVIERVTLKLASVAFNLPTVSVEDTIKHPWLATFERRRLNDRGTYFTRQDIVRSQVQTLSNILRRIPGAQITRNRFGGQEVVFHQAMIGGRPCHPQIFVHAMNYSGDVDDFHPEDVEAMEVYPSIASVPAELQTAKAQACGAIVIWTREPPPKGANPDSGGVQPRW
jgi:hypothetical protein